MKTHYVSRHKFPTRIIMAGQNAGTLHIGHIAARRDLESRLKRRLEEPVIVDVVGRGGNWRFREGV